MKNRMIKKMAKQFIDGRKKYRVVEERLDSRTVVGNYDMPDKVRREVNRLARRAGWDGCHWDAPWRAWYVQE